MDIHRKLIKGVESDKKFDLGKMLIIMYVLGMQYIS